MATNALLEATPKQISESAFSEDITTEGKQSEEKQETLDVNLEEEKIIHKDFLILDYLKQYDCKCDVRSHPLSQPLYAEDYSEPSSIISLLKDKTAFDSATATREYIKERKLEKVIHFLLTKLLSEMPDKPLIYLTQLLEECMLFRAGVVPAPVLFEERHLKALVQSFDPCSKGWITVAHLARAASSIGLEHSHLSYNLEDKVPTDKAICLLTEAQHKYIENLLCIECVKKRPIIICN